MRISTSSPPPTPSLGRRARRVRLIGMDVDGVLTRGEIIILNSGEELKIWNARDRVGFAIARLGLPQLRFAWVTARASRQVAARARELGVHALYQRCHRKGEAFIHLLRRFRLQPEEVAFLGDDLVDLPVLTQVGLAVCPSDAPAEVQRAVHYVTVQAGGTGVLREVVELVLQAQGCWEAAVDRYLGTTREGRIRGQTPNADRFPKCEGVQNSGSDPLDP